MKLVVTSDWHHDWTTEGVARREEVERAVWQSVSRATEASETDDVVYLFCGDLADPHRARSHSAVAFAAKIAFQLADEGVPSIWLTGNHDVIEDGSGGHVLEALKWIDKDVRVVDVPGLVQIAEGVEMLALPFTPTCLGYDPVEVVRRHGPSEPRVVAGHLNIEGITAGSETKDMPRGRDVYWPIDDLALECPDAVLVGGHYHDPQTFRGVNIVGSLARLSFGESTPPSYLEVEL